MGEATIDALWKKTDLHGKQISDLHAITAVHSSRLDQHATEFRKMNSEMNQQHGEIRKGLADLAGELRDFNTAYLETRGELMGAAKVGKWGIATLLTTTTILIAIAGLLANLLL